MPSGPDDEELVASALAGDRTARRSLADRLLDPIQREVAFCLMRFAGPAGRDPRQDVRDMVQEVLLALFERDAQELRRWDPARGRSLASFVRLVARRRVARILGQRTGNPWSDAPTAPEKLDTEDDARLLQRLEERHALDRLLVLLTGQMTAKDQDLFELLFVEGLDPEEVALQQDMTRGAVNAWSYRMRKLARSIAAHLAGPESSTGAATTMEGVKHGA